MAQQEQKEKVNLNIGEFDTANPSLGEIADKTYNFYTKEENLNHIEWSDIEYKLYKKFINIAVSHNNGQFNPLNRNILQAEQYIKYEVPEKWAILPNQERLKITGIIDLICENENIIEVTDWKTAKTMKDFTTGKEINYKTLQDDVQLRFYHYYLSKIYGCDRTFILTMFFLRQSTPISISFGCNDLEATENKIKTKFLEILNTKIPKLKKGWYCTKTCDFGINTFQNTKIQPITQFLNNQITNIGQPMCICNQIELETNRHGLQWVIEEMSNKRD